VAYSAFGPGTSQYAFTRVVVAILTLDNGINRAALLTQSAVDALGHINVVSGCPPATVLTLFGFNCDGLGRADGLAELACDATFFTGRIATEGMLASEAGRDRPLLEGVVDGVSAME
jgi:hypothetical protein